MALIIPPGFGQVAWQWELTGDPERVVVTCGVDLASAGGGFQASCDHARDLMAATFNAGDFSNQYTFRGAILRVGQDGAPPLIFESSITQPGTFTGAVLPQNCALLVRKLTASAGRRNRGRMYFPPIPMGEGSIDAVGTIDSSARTAAQTKFTALRTAMLAGGAIAIPPVILHSSEVGETVLSPTPVTSFSLDSKIATQRRRLRR